MKGSFIKKNGFFFFLITILVQLICGLKWLNRLNMLEIYRSRPSLVWQVFIVDWLPVSLNVILKSLYSSICKILST